MKKEFKSRGIPLDEIRLANFKDPKRAKFAIKLALEDFEKDNNLEILLDTLRLVAQAKGGFAALAKKTSISQQAINDALSPHGNPRLRNFQTVLGSLGLRMVVKPVRGQETEPH